MVPNISVEKGTPVSCWKFLGPSDVATLALVKGQSSAVCYEKHSHGGRGTPWMAEGGTLGVTVVVGLVLAGILRRRFRRQCRP